MSGYRADGSGAVPVRPLELGERVKFHGDRRWWTVQALSPNYAVLVRQVAFQPAGTLCYTVLDWRNGVRGACNLIGQGYGDGSYSRAQCTQMLARFEARQLDVSQRNWVRIRFADDKPAAPAPAPAST